jgi:hypothetical protein
VLFHLSELPGHLGDALLVELQGLGYVVEHAEVIDDQPVGLAIAIGPVGAADGL